MQTRRAIVGESYGAPVGPTVGVPCHGCNATSGIPVTFAGSPGELLPITHPTPEYPPIGYPSITNPMPLTPGPKVIPSYELPNPMPVPKTGTEK